MECKKELVKQRGVGRAKLVEGHTHENLEARADALNSAWSMSVGGRFCR